MSDPGDVSGQLDEVEDDAYLTHAVVLPLYWYRKFMSSLVLGALVGTFVGFATNGLVGALVGCATAAILWRVLRHIAVASPPFDGARVVALRTHSFEVQPTKGKEILRRRSIADLESYVYKPGHGRYGTARATFAFEDGEIW